MNNGKICVSVCAETVDKLIENIKRSENSADVIEIRFDCLEESEFNCLDSNKSQRILNKIFNRNYKRPLILTFRPKEQGGKRNLSKDERNVFWNAGFDGNWADLEEDVIENSFSRLLGKRICSHHDFESVPANLDEIYQRLKATKADIVKIAVQADDIVNTVEIWKLLEKANQANEQIIPIAMGEAGKWTRILGLAYGAFMTYAALESGKETASGQISAQDLIETYRVKELDEQTEIYGIIGNPVSHSLSPYIHNAAFKFHKLNAVYVPFAVTNLDEFIAKFIRAETREVELNIKGFSVTIPHKQTIIKHLDSIDENAKAIGAVNTVKIFNGKLHGFNTDAQGFIDPLKTAYGDLKNVTVGILGNGGAARAAIYALQNEQAKVILYARNPAKAKGLTDEFQIEIAEINAQDLTFDAVDILINATPLGTKGALENETPVLADHIKNVHMAYDLVYNPFETRFLREAKSAGVPTLGGLSMLISQAMAQFKIWTNLDAPIKEMGQAALRKL